VLKEHSKLVFYKIGLIEAVSKELQISMSQTVDNRKNFAQIVQINKKIIFFTFYP